MAISPGTLVDVFTPAREDFLHDMTIVARQLQKQNLVRATARQRREAVVAAQDAYRAAHPA